MKRKRLAFDPSQSRPPDEPLTFIEQARNQSGFLTGGTMHKKIGLILLSIIMMMMVFSPSHGLSKTDLSQTTPPELYKWKEWILSDNETALCPTRYNDQTAYFCTWPTSLELEIRKKSGIFSQQWLVYGDTMVSLPGNSTAWPVEVTVDGKQAPVVSRDGFPAVFLEKGSHTVTGNFKWIKTPLMLNVPPSVGLVALTLFGEEILSPQIDAKGRLWLQKEKSEEIKEDRYAASVYRLINDGIPMLITTQLQLKVSGSVREILFPGLLFKESFPVTIKSVLPVRIEENGDVALQARPGTWDIRITSRCPGPVSELECENPLSGPEIWSFQARNQFRMVTLEGAPAIDPSQSEMPPEWRQYPAHVLKKGETLVFKETKRGDPDPAPDQLNLHRIMWLDFDGKGITIRDTIDGALRRSWSISMNSPGKLGRVSVNGEDRLITKQGPEKKPGVELRKGDLLIEADSRYTGPEKTIPAVGWDHDFQQVSGVLNLPPGWRLFSTGGIDHIPGTWLQKWTLMDIFLTLIISVALLKLRGRYWGGLALITLCLIFHEPGAPKTIWLFIIAAMALVKALPEGRFKYLAGIVSLASVIVLLVISIPFMVQQLRWGVFPQLEPVWYDAYQSAPIAGSFEKQQVKAEMKRASRYDGSLAADREFSLDEISDIQAMLPEKMVETYDPDALVQTGPGVPDWRWRSYPFSWNGPVKSDQEMTLRLISPLLNLFLSGLRVLMLALLIYCVMDIREVWNAIKNKKIAVNMAALCFFCLLSSPVLTKAAEDPTAFPPLELLRELESRLLEKHACYPNCADISALEITAQTDTLQLLFNIDAIIDTAIPLPVNETSWRPETILLDGKPVKGLQREISGPLWALIPRGSHRLAVLGNTLSENSIQLPFILRPHFTSFRGSGWDIVGISTDGKIGSSIQLTRLDKTEQNRTSETFETSTVPVFLDVERTFHLGITWHVTTTFRHLSETRSSIALSYPLLPNEAVTSGNIEVKSGKAVITLAPNQTVTLESTLEVTPEIRLNAPENVPWMERWVLDAGPIWHCDLSGIPVIHHQDGTGQWRPTWKPWPGENVSIAVSRPEAIVGQSITIDAATLNYTPGQRYNQAHLNLSIRTSRGGQHRIELTEEALLQQVRIDGKSLPVQLEGRAVSIPLHPGTNDIAIEWQQISSSGFPIKSPKIKIGDPAGGGAVNTDITFNVPSNRWILLTGGPRLGPAVLFWSYLIVVVLAAFGLKHVTFTPLKFRHWLLLGIGLTQVSPVPAIIVVAWFIALGARAGHAPKEKWFFFNLIQIGLVFLTLLAIGSLYIAVEKGLLGLPDMQIAGNGSTSTALHWTQDRVASFMPNAWAVAVPIWVYHLLMLLWSLWLAFSLVNWLRWGWKCFGREGLWKHRKKIIV